MTKKKPRSILRKQTDKKTVFRIEIRLFKTPQFYSTFRLILRYCCGLLYYPSKEKLSLITRCTHV